MRWPRAPSQVGRPGAGGALAGLPSPERPAGQPITLEALLRGVNVGQSALDVLTVYADRILPGPGQRTVSDRYDAYRRSGVDIDQAANMAMRDYGEALQVFAEAPRENIVARGVAQAARVVGLAQTVAAPAPVPGGAALPFVAGGLRRVGKEAAKAAAEAAEDVVEKPGFLRTAEDLVRERGLRRTQAQDAIQQVGAQEVAREAVSRSARNAAALGLRTGAGVSDLPDKDAVFAEIGANLDKMAVDDTTKELILANAAENFDEIAKMSFADQRRGVVAVSDMLRAAAEKVPDLDLARLAATRRGTAMNAETLLSVGMALNRTAQNVTELTATVAREGATDETRLRLLLETLQMNTLQRVFAGGRAEAGRTLRALRETMGAQADPRSLYEAAAKHIGGRQNAEQLIRALEAIWNRPGLSLAQRERDVYAFINQLDSPGKFEQLKEVWRNSILSNPITQEINFIGNAMLLVTERAATQTAAAAIEAARAGFGLRRVEREVYFSEIVPGIVGTFRGAPRGFAKGFSVLATGQDMRDVSKFVESGGKFLRAEAIGGPVGTAINAPIRMLAGVDALFSEMAYQGEIYAQAARTAAREGLRGQAFAAQVARTVANPALDIMEKAAKRAELITLKTAPDKVTRAIMQLREESRVGMFVAPFIQTPSNLLKLGIAYSPAGFLRALPLRGEERALMLGRAAVGSALMWYFGTKLLDGEVTAGAPSDAKERELFYAQGKQPYSIRVGDDWVQFRRFEPLSTPLNWTAALFDAWQRGKGDWSKTVPMMSLAVGRALLDSTYLSGMSQFVDALQDPERNAERMAASLLTGFIPFSGFLRGVAQAGDPYLRAPENVLETIQSRFPGLSERVRPQLAITGQPVMRPPSRRGLGALANPVLISPVARNATLEELGRLARPDTFGAGGEIIPGEPLELGFPAETIRGMGLSVDESFGLRQNAQELSMRKLAALFSSQRYLEASEDQRRVLAEREIAAARFEARGVIAQEMLEAARTPEQVARAVLARISTLATDEGPGRIGQRALFLDDLAGRGLLSPTVVNAVDAARPPLVDGGLPEPSVAEYLRAAPLVRGYAALPPFRIGTREEWARLEEARSLRALVEAKAQTAAQRDPRAVMMVLRAANPQAAALVAKYDDPRTRDPRRAAMVARQPWLRRFVAGLEYE